MNRSVACPNCDYEFATGTHKCICPKCGSAFFRESARWCDSSVALVPKPPPESLESVSDYHRKLAHWILDGIAEIDGPFGWYGFESTGLAGIAGWLVDLGYLERVARDYSITAMGRAKLQVLTELHGTAAYPGRTSRST